MSMSKAELPLKGVFMMKRRILILLVALLGLVVVRWPNLESTLFVGYSPCTITATRGGLQPHPILIEQLNLLCAMLRRRSRSIKLRASSSVVLSLLSSTPTAAPAADQPTSLASHMPSLNLVQTGTGQREA